MCCRAEGRYLSAARDLNVPPVLDSSKVSPSAQWKVSSQGITNVQHPHKVCRTSCSRLSWVTTH